MRSNKFTVMQAARMYGIPIIDTGDDTRWGVLLGSGCGLMMGVLDVVPFRYCLDIDSLPRAQRTSYELRQFAVMANQADDGGLALVGWFSLTDPTFLREVFTEAPGLVYAGNIALGVPGEVATLQQFLDVATKRWNPFTAPTVRP